MKKLFALLLVLALIFTFAACGDKKSDKDSEDSRSNSYETPVEIAVEQLNSKKYVDAYSKTLEEYNGFCEDEIKDLINLAKNSTGWEENQEHAKENFDEYIEENKEQYGSDYKYSYKILEKQKYDELDDFVDQLKETADSYKAMLDNFSYEDWEDLAYDQGLSVDVDDLKEIYEAAYEKYKEAEIEEGYELEVELTLSGSNLGEDEVETANVYVLKIDGIWVPSSVIYGFLPDYY